MVSKPQEVAEAQNQYFVEKINLLSRGLRSPRMKTKSMNSPRPSLKKRKERERKVRHVEEKQRRDLGEQKARNAT